MPTYDYWVWNNVLSKEFCEQEIARLDWSKSSKGLVSNSYDLVVDPEARITDVLWVDNITPIGCVAQIYANMANDMAKWNFNLSSCEQIQMGKYEGDKCGFYDWHVDGHTISYDESNLVRKISVSILLSDPKDFQGGALEFENTKEQPKLTQGSVIAFRSLLKHRVTPVTFGTRYSAVAWISGPNYR